jgi:hypothetical protein
MEGNPPKPGCMISFSNVNTLEANENNRARDHHTGVVLHTGV